MARDDTKLLQAILDNQKELTKKVDKGFKEVKERLDLQGAQLAYLEDDAPTTKEFNQLKRKVAKLEAVVYK